MDPDFAADLIAPGDVVTDELASLGDQA